MRSRIPVSENISRKEALREEMMKFQDSNFTGMKREHSGLYTGMEREHSACTVCILVLN